MSAYAPFWTDIDGRREGFDSWAEMDARLNKHKDELCERNRRIGIARAMDRYVPEGWQEVTPAEATRVETKTMPDGTTVTRYLRWRDESFEGGKL